MIMSLHVFLQHRLVILCDVFLPQMRQLVGKLTLHIGACRIPATVEIDRTDHRLKDILEVVLPLCPAAEHLAAPHAQMCSEMQPARQPCEGLTLDETCTHLRQFPLRTAWIGGIEIRTDRELEDSIAQKLQSLVMRCVSSRLVGIGGMCQSLVKNGEIGKICAEGRRKAHEFRAPFFRHRICHDYFAYFLTTRQALCPPKPNELEIAARTVLARALFGT